jgi:hypothetical protein
MAVDDVNETVSGSRFATIDWSVVEGLSVGAAPLPGPLVARAFGRGRAVRGRLGGRRPRPMPRAQLPKPRLARCPGQPPIECFRRSASCLAADVGSLLSGCSPSYGRPRGGPPASRLGARSGAPCAAVPIRHEREGCSESKPPPRQVASHTSSMSPNRVGADRCAGHRASTGQARWASSRIAVGHSAQARAALPHVANSGWHVRRGGRTVASSARGVAVLLRAMGGSPADVSRGPNDGASAERARKASKGSARSSRPLKESRWPQPRRFSTPSRESAPEFRELGEAAACHGSAQHEQRARQAVPNSVPLRLSRVMEASGNDDRRASPKARGSGAQRSCAGSHAASPQRIFASHRGHRDCFGNLSGGRESHDASTVRRVVMSTPRPYRLDRSSSMLDHACDSRAVSRTAVWRGRRSAALVGVWRPVRLEQACSRLSILECRHGVWSLAAETSRRWPAELGPWCPDGP